MKKVIGIALIFVVWQMTALLIKSELLLPSPLKTTERLIYLIFSGKIFLPLLNTILKALIGFSLALVVGFIFGFLMGLNNFIYEILRPLVSVIQSVPIISWLALVILWWGIGSKGPIMIVFLTLFPIVTLNIYEGVMNIDKKLVEMARVYGVRKTRIFMDIYLGSIFPFFISAISVSSGLLWKSIAVAEFMAGSSGIGVEIAWAKSRLETVDVFAYTMILVVLGILSEVFLRSVEKKFLY